MSAYPALLAYMACSNTDGSIYEIAIKLLAVVGGMVIGLVLMIAITNITDRFSG